MMKTQSMASCFNPHKMNVNEDDSVILFSASNSPDDEYSVSSSSSSTRSHHSPEITRYGTTSGSYKLTVTGLSYTVRPALSLFPFCRLFQRPEPITIIKSVTFMAKSSEILAVVGPSGTGKSTLLRIISGRMKQKEIDSDAAILINDRKITHFSQLRRVCGFVPQDDDLLPLLTVKETLIYSAQFRLREASVDERDERVEILLRDLGLVHVRDSFVGEGDEEDRGISGGERKRVSIAVEMIRDPAILLLDEPTSGLDSKNSLQVIELLASMAKSKQRTVVLSIHQPSYRILSYISNFLILSRGRVVHNGNLESLEESIARLGFQIPNQLNPLEFAMEIIDSMENPNQGITIDRTTASQNPIYSDQDEHDHIQRCSDRFLDLREIGFLCSRFWKIIYRTKQLFLARTMQAIVGGLGLASVYVKVGRDESGVAERLGLFAFSLSFLLSSPGEALPIYLQERRVLMKESSRGAYRISSYMIANTITFLPFLFVVSLLFSVPVYWIVGLNPSFQAFSFFVFIVWLIVMMASSLVLFLSAVSPDFISGNSLICTVLGAFFLFSGYFIPKEFIPKYWRFMYYVSLYRYPLDSMLVNEYWSVRDACFDNHVSENGSYTCLLTGGDVLRSRGLEKDTRWVNAGIMLGFFVIYRVVCWAVLVRKASRSTL